MLDLYGDFLRFSQGSRVVVGLATSECCSDGEEQVGDSSHRSLRSHRSVRRSRCVTTTKSTPDCLICECPPARKFAPRNLLAMMIRAFRRSAVNSTARTSSSRRSIPRRSRAGEAIPNPGHSDPRNGAGRSDPQGRIRASSLAPRSTPSSSGRRRSTWRRSIGRPMRRRPGRRRPRRRADSSSGAGERTARPSAPEGQAGNTPTAPRS